MIGKVARRRGAQRSRHTCEPLDAGNPPADASSVMIMPAIFALPDDAAALAERLSPRRNLYHRGLISQVSDLFDRVHHHGDAAVRQATENIALVNRELRPEPLWTKEVAPGRVVGEKSTPLDSVGLWIPSRKGPLLSTALMLVTAAKVVGVREIQVGMPPSVDGRPDAATVAAATLAGATSFVCGNGVAIIAGWSVGTESIPKVHGVFGPGPG